MRRMVLALVVMSSSSFLSGESAPATGRSAWELTEGAENSYIGPVLESAVESGGHVVYLATPARLYRVLDGKVEKHLDPPERGARLLLAPGGRVLAWVLPLREYRGLRRALLVNTDGKELGRLKVDESPGGFSTLYLGFEGKTIVTESPLEDPEGLDGRCFYCFWDSSGKRMEKLVLPGRQHVVLDDGGTAALLLGADKVLARRVTGQPVWEVKGKYRKAALGKDASLALLNPAVREDTDKVHVFKGGKLAATLQVPAPVHELRLAPDGSVAAVVGSGGRYFYLDTASAKLEEGPRLQVSGPFAISSAEFVGDGLLAFGLLHREGDERPAKWPRASILAVDRRGRLAFRREIAVREATASVPAIDVALGAFVGRTENAVIFVTFEQ